MPGDHVPLWIEHAHVVLLCRPVDPDQVLVRLLHRLHLPSRSWDLHGARHPCTGARGATPHRTCSMVLPAGAQVHGRRWMRWEARVLPARGPKLHALDGTGEAAGADRTRPARSRRKFQYQADSSSIPRPKPAKVPIASRVQTIPNARPYDNRTSPRFNATSTAWVRSVTSSLSKTRLRWFLSVPSGIDSADWISLLDRPRARSSSTDSSRVESGSPRPTSLAATAAGKRCPPACTSRMASSIPSGKVSLSR